MTVTTNTGGSTAGTPVPAPVDLVTLTIDGIEVSVPKGTLVIRAAELLGIQIPRFCDHPLLDPVGACRQCLVEVEGQRKPLSSCTTTVTDGMVVKTQLTSPVAEKAQHGMMELLLINHPLDCPVCDKGGECPLQNQAMSNGHAEIALPRRQAHLSRSRSPISAQVLLDRERCVLCARCTRFSAADRRRPVHRAVRARRAASRSRIYDDRAVRVLLLRQHRADLPGRRADRRRVPVPGPAVRPRVDRRASASTARPAARCAPTTGAARCCAGWPATTPEVNEEWNCDKGRWAFSYATAARPPRPRRWSATTNGDLVAGVLARGARASRPRAWPRARRRRRRRADRRPAHRRGRLRLREVRPGRARHQRHRLPGPPALGRGAGLPRRRASPAASCESTYADLEAAPAVLLVGFEPEEESPIVFLRLRKAAPQGHAHGVRRSRRSRPAGCARRSAACSQPCPAPRRPCSTRSRPAAPVDDDRDGGRRGAAAAGAVDPGRRAARVGARRADRRGRGWPTRPARKLAWVPRRAGERGAVEAGALPNLLPGGRPVADARRAPRWRGTGRRPLPATPGRDTAAILRAAAPATLGALVVGGVDPDDLPDPAARARRARRGAVRGQPRAARSRRSPSAPTSSSRSPRRSRRPAPSSTGRAGRGRSTRRSTDTGALADHRVLNALADEMDVHLGLPERARPRGPSSTRWAPGRRRRPASSPSRRHAAPPAPAPARRSSRPGTCCSTTAGCRTASRTWPAPPGAPWPGCPRPPRRRSASPTAHR